MPGGPNIVRPHRERICLSLGVVDDPQRLEQQQRLRSGAAGRELICLLGTDKPPDQRLCVLETDVCEPPSRFRSLDRSASLAAAASAPSACPSPSVRKMPPNSPRPTSLDTLFSASSVKTPAA